MRGFEKALVAASLAFGTSFPLAWLLDLPSWLEIVWKGGAVGSLALAAALAARRADGWLLAGLLGWGAAGDVLLEISFPLGAGAFGLGHATAIFLYVRNRRRPLSRSDWGVAGALLFFGALIPLVMFPAGRGVVAFTGYALLLCGMTAAAWTSRFPRRLVGLGAILFLVSDTLIAVRLGMEARPAALGLAIWASYYAGQLLIFLGVNSSPSGDGEDYSPSS